MARLLTPNGLDPSEIVVGLFVLVFGIKLLRRYLPVHEYLRAPENVGNDRLYFLINKRGAKSR